MRSQSCNSVLGQRLIRSGKNTTSQQVRNQMFLMTQIRCPTLLLHLQDVPSYRPWQGGSTKQSPISPFHHCCLQGARTHPNWSRASRYHGVACGNQPSAAQRCVLELRSQHSSGQVMTLRAATCNSMGWAFTPLWCIEVPSSLAKHSLPHSG